ncbi:MAG: hypothetical protein ACXAEU_14570 [Candidatus Hodarchaeales archaeon]|jgi:uncharacterized BrkB/YihY/UPF0761 family membrane protein
MAKSGIASLGLVLSLIGALVLVIFGILRIVGAFVTELEALLGFDISLFGNDQTMRIVGGLIAILLGVIVIWAWQKKKVKAKDDYLLWGIIFIVIGIIGGSLGGLLILVGGILIVIGYFV